MSAYLARMVSGGGYRSFRNLGKSMAKVFPRPMQEAARKAEQDRILAAISRQQREQTVPERPEFSGDASKAAADAAAVGFGDLSHLPQGSQPAPKAELQPVPHGQAPPPDKNN